jgi:hypothetical protein
MDCPRLATVQVSNYRWARPRKPLSCASPAWQDWASGLEFINARRVGMVSQRGRDLVAHHLQQLFGNIA